MGEVVVTLSELEQRLVAPFYLQMMGFGAAGLEPKLRDEMVRVSTTATIDEVRQLLRSGWRPLVMGTWFALAMPGDEIKDDVVTAMASSAGGLTAPPLAAVSALLAGAEAIGAMQTYAEWIGDPARRDGSQEVVAAAIADLGGTPPVVASPAAVSDFRALYQRADQLRHAFRAARGGVALL
ncbi:hypothetical protein ACFWEJ_12525 [Promicromonospora sp. NPDC060204]|uniref:hypothetical protein n=1 Tax=Promicromonospora sp. NPDC060204 TaxID=3347071 RepID=UPI003668E0CE